MDVFVAADIFGVTPALDALCMELSQKAQDLYVIDPYMGTDHKFETETDAYRFFMDQVGLDRYQSILLERISRCRPGSVLIGFSVGAAAAWIISASHIHAQIQKAFCFYGSQIRNHTPIHPLFDMELIFPCQEPHFDVDGLIELLKTRDRVTCSKAKGLHGFMNRLSPHFDSSCFKTHMDYLKASIEQLKHPGRPDKTALMR